MGFDSLKHVQRYEKRKGEMKTEKRYTLHFKIKNREKKLKI